LVRRGLIDPEYPCHGFLRRRESMSVSVNLVESHYASDPSVELLEITIGDLLRECAADVPDRVALVDGAPDAEARRSWTYAELLDSAERIARALLARFEPGERVAIWAPNCAEWMLLQQGAALAGGVRVAPVRRGRNLLHRLLPRL
jgi:fatty-acyl-CoA synthase